MVISLVLVCIAAAFGLAWVYGKTMPVIERQRADAINRALNEVLPEAVRFEEHMPDTLWYGYDASGGPVGSVIKVAPRGYAGPIETLAGVGLDGRLTGLVITSLRETPGLGLKASETWFREQFRGRTVDEIKLRQDGGVIDGISAATITARAVANGIREGIESLGDRFLPETPGHAVLCEPIPASDQPDSAPADQP